MSVRRYLLKKPAKKQNNNSGTPTSSIAAAAPTAGPWQTQQLLCQNWIASSNSFMQGRTFPQLSSSYVGSFVPTKIPVTKYPGKYPFGVQSNML